MRAVDNFADQPEPGAGPVTRWLLRALGVLFVGLGIVGAFLPLMPTTIFLILAAGCFARSSPKLDAWLMNHPRFGPVLRAWREHGAVPRRAKVMACAGMLTGFAVFFFGVHPKLWLAAAVGGALLLIAAYVVSRPAPTTAP
jgi:uncharacterized membrane protein YbaN (DUF454 family)